MTEQSFGPERPAPNPSPGRRKPERENPDWTAVVGVLGTLIIICTTIVLLVKL